jgi:VWFA-related protein
MIRLLVALALAAGLSSAATRLLVTVVEQKTGKPVTGLAAGDFSVFDGRSQRAVQEAAYSQDLLDIMLLLDTSLMGPMVEPVFDNIVAQIQPKEQMALVSFHSSADLIQDFTSSKELLRRAIAGVKYGNSPHVLDAIYAAMNGGFEHATFRRVILLLTAGVEGSSRVDEREVIRMARSQGVSIFPVYMVGDERTMFENLARQTGGATFSLRAISKNERNNPGPRIFEAVRGHYILSLAGNLSLGEKLRVEVKRQDKPFVSALPLE